VTQQVVIPWYSEETELTGLVDQPAIAIDPSDGSVWIAFSYWSCPPFDCAPSYADGIFLVNNAGGTWSEPVQLTDSINLHGCEVHSSLAVQNGHLYLACASDGDYVQPHGGIMFGTDASGVWSEDWVVLRGVLPHLLLNADGQAAILFASSDLRYARPKPNGGFAIEHLPGSAEAGGSWVYSALAVDPVTGDTWAAWTGAANDQGDHPLYLAKRGADGWSDPTVAIADGDLIGLGVRDGVVQVIADKSGLTYASNASGAFVEQVIDASTDHYWGDTAFALLPSGRPIVVIARDEPDSSRSGMWLLKGPAV
jgi:hypothetical protein